jgi:hypothetical protein
MVFIERSLAFARDDARVLSSYRLTALPPYRLTALPPYRLTATALTVPSDTSS